MIRHDYFSFLVPARPPPPPSLPIPPTSLANEKNPGKILSKRKFGEIEKENKLNWGDKGRIHGHGPLNLGLEE